MKYYKRLNNDDKELCSVWASDDVRFRCMKPETWKEKKFHDWLSHADHKVLRSDMLKHPDIWVEVTEAEALLELI